MLVQNPQFMILLVKIRNSIFLLKNFDRNMCVHQLKQLLFLVLKPLMLSIQGGLKKRGHLDFLKFAQSKINQF